MRIAYSLLFIIALAITACKNGQKKVTPLKYNREYVVTTTTEIGDSILHDKTIEYFAQINLNDSICKWNKRYFNRVYDNYNAGGTAYTYDTLDIHYSLNNKFEISKILNWNQIFNKVKLQCDQLIASAPVSRREVVKNFIYNYSLDSAIVINKHTQDIAVFNIGLQFLNEEANMDPTIYKINKGDKYDTLTFKYIIDAKNTFSAFSELFAEAADLKGIDIEVEAMYLRNNNNFEIDYIKYSAAVLVDGIEHKTTTLMD